MARKKSKKTEDKVINTTSSGIAYNGNVTIKLVNNGRVIKTVRKHNSGCDSLFYFLAHCLKGEYVGNERPFYIMGYHKEGTPTAASLGTVAMYTTAPLADSQVSAISGGGYTTSFKFAIPATSIREDVITGDNKLNVFALYSVNNKDDAFSGVDSSAFIYLDDTKAIQESELSSGITIVVIWNMSVTNGQ